MVAGTAAIERPAGARAIGRGSNYRITHCMTVPDSVQWVSAVLLAIPAPTEHWASIIGSLAWPGVVVFLVFRFRKYLKSYLETIAERLRRDHVKIGPFELTPNSDVIPLDPEEADTSTEHYEPEDIERIEKIFEFIAETANMRKLEEWVESEVGSSVEIADFVTFPEYAKQREQAVGELKIGAV